MGGPGEGVPHSAKLTWNTNCLSTNVWHASSVPHSAKLTRNTNCLSTMLGTLEPCIPGGADLDHNCLSTNVGHAGSVRIGGAHLEHRLSVDECVARWKRAYR